MMNNVILFIQYDKMYVHCSTHRVMGRITSTILLANLF